MRCPALPCEHWKIPSRTLLRRVKLWRSERGGLDKVRHLHGAAIGGNHASLAVPPSRGRLRVAISVRSIAEGAHKRRRARRLSHLPPSGAGGQQHARKSGFSGSLKLGEPFGSETERDAAARAERGRHRSGRRRSAHRLGPARSGPDRPPSGAGRDGQGLLRRANRHEAPVRHQGARPPPRRRWRRGRLRAPLPAGGERGVEAHPPERRHDLRLRRDGRRKLLHRHGVPRREVPLRRAEEAGASRPSARSTSRGRFAARSARRTRSASCTAT